MPIYARTTRVTVASLDVMEGTPIDLIEMFKTT